MAKAKEKSVTKKELYALAVRTRKELRLARTELAGVSNKRDIASHARNMARNARIGFGEFLSRPPWDWYVTQTFKGDYMSPKQGDKHYYAWMRSLEMACNARQMPRPFYCRVTELQQREVLHYHSLIGGLGDVRRLLFKDFWELNGYARVEAYDANRGAAGYLGKYLTKDDGDIRFSHNIDHHFTTFQEQT